MEVGAGRDKQTVERGSPFEFEMDGQRLMAYEGETLAAALLASGKRIMRRTARYDKPRGVYCGMGICFDCLVIVNGVPNLRACQTLAMPGMKVQIQRGLSEGSLIP